MTKRESSNEVCSICGSQKRSLRSVFQKVASNTYADLIRFLTNIPINENNGNSNKICKICRGKAEEAYDFIQMVIRVHGDMYGTPILGKLKFDNINSIKKECDPIKIESSIFEDNIVRKSFDESFYNDVRITKIKTEPEEMSLEEFLNDNDIDYDVGNEDFKDEDDYLDDKASDDKDYLPNRYPQKKPTVKRGKGRPRKLLPEVEADLEPIVMEEVREKSIDQPQPILVPKILPLLRTVKSKQRRKKLDISKRKPPCKETLCPHCGKLCRHLNTHILTHIGVKEFQCTLCPRKYFKAAQLNNHMITHTGEKKFKCDNCNMAFYSATLLKSHQSTHKEIRDHICEVCSKSFKRRSTLLKHVIRHNSANKTVKCDLCNMTFFEKFNLVHHMRIHTGERPFKCELCSQPYSYKPDFNRHCFKKHGVYIKRRLIKEMTQEVLEKERADVKALFDSRVTVSLPTPITEFPCVIDEAQLKRLFGHA